MRILHTESSSGWGGQEIRILSEAEGMRERGHEVVFAIASGGGLAKRALEKGFIVYELSYRRPSLIKALCILLRIIFRHKIQLVNTHSSLDAWVGGVAARIARKRVIRTRHLSTPSRPGINSRLLYKGLADFVVTTSSALIPTICKLAGIPSSACKCIPTGVDPSHLVLNAAEREEWRRRLGAGPLDCVVGTVCFMRSWKGIEDFLGAAQRLQKHTHIKWVIVGGGYIETYRQMAKEKGLEKVVVFTGHLDAPFAAFDAIDIFTLLSTANEGISQASLQAAFLKKPLITTPIGGLPEVCLDGKTGIIVPTHSPESVADAVLQLVDDPLKRKKMGEEARVLVEEKYTFEHTLDAMEQVYKNGAV